MELSAPQSTMEQFSAWERNCVVCLVIENGLSFCRHDTKYIPNGVVPPWRQTSTYNLNGHAGVLSKRSMKAVVTGGGGYFGYSLGCALAKSGASVILYDIQKPPSEVPNGAAFIQV